MKYPDLLLESLNEKNPEDAVKSVVNCYYSKYAETMNVIGDVGVHKMEDDTFRAFLHLYKKDGEKPHPMTICQSYDYRFDFHQECE